MTQNKVIKHKTIVKMRNDVDKLYICNLIYNVIILQVGRRGDQIHPSPLKKITPSKKKISTYFVQLLQGYLDIMF